jgi:hypothetical protein
VQREFDEYLKCGRLEHGFLRVVCDGCHAEKLVAFSCRRRRAGYRRRVADCGAVTNGQRTRPLDVRSMDGLGVTAQVNAR